jgi:hypothetical protein
VRDFDPANVRLGSFASIVPGTKVRLSPDFRHVRRLSDLSRCARNGREQMQRTVALFYHLVGADQERFRDIEIDCVGGLEVDNQLEARRHLDRQIARLLAF